MVEATIPQQQQQQNHQRKLEHYPKTVQLHNHDLANDWRVQQPAVPSTQSTFSMLNPTIGTRLDDLWIGNGNGNGRHKIQQQQQPHRLLGNSNDNNAFQSVFVDADGNAYEPYALAWRYLGMYMDCDMYDEEEEAENENGKERQRHLSNDSDDGECTRKLLWAAVRVPQSLEGKTTDNN